MIRFLPDTWSDALLRYFAMAAPNANVYVEIAAPDLRFAAIALLALAVGVLLMARRLAAPARAACALLLLMLAFTGAWLLTSGNGRYFIPALLCAGPLVVALIYLLPLTRSFRFTIALGLFAAQVYVLAQNTPWDAWSWTQWREAPYFQLDAPAQREENVTYVSVAGISYSLVAPQFPASSRWINLSNLGRLGRDAGWSGEFLRQATTLKMIAPTLPGQMTADGQPNEAVRQALDETLGTHRLALDPAGRCELLRSRSLAKYQSRNREPEPGLLAESGLWICPLRYPVEPPPPAPGTPADAEVDAVFKLVEAMCPRYFRSHEGRTLRIQGGAVRQYPSSDMKIYVLDDGTVMYKYWRALNPVHVGTREGILAGRDRVSCEHVRGRSGLPWDREI